MSIFSYNKDLKKNAYLNWRTQSGEDFTNFQVLGDGYLMSSEILIKDCIENNIDNRADVVIFPILHGAIHGIEVYFKSIHNLIAIWLKDEVKYRGGHNINQLYFEVYKILERLNKDHSELFDYTQFKSDLSVIKEFIDDIYSKTPETEFVRYPMSKKRMDFFYVDSYENVVVNLELLLSKVSRIRRILYEISMHLMNTYDELKQLEYEVQEELKQLEYEAREELSQYMLEEYEDYE